MPCPVRLWAWWPRWLLTIIINNVYAFQYPTKNRCTILVQPSFAKLVLLPIREAYEWKPRTSCSVLLSKFILASNSWSVWMETLFFEPMIWSKRILLPIREAYEWKRTKNSTDPRAATCFQFVKRMNGNSLSGAIKQPEKLILLPIREAYEWKPGTARQRIQVGHSCFQFVKRMNGNYSLPQWGSHLCLFLASNSWSVWMETISCQEWPNRISLATRLASNSWSVWMETTRVWGFSKLWLNSCFQFVKRMNGNVGVGLFLGETKTLLPIREAYEWKHTLRFYTQRTAGQKLASNSWSVWMETVSDPPHSAAGGSCFQFVKRMNGNR